MRAFGYAIVPGGEVVDALRSQVGRQMSRSVRLGRKMEALAAKNGRLKSQIADDQRYIDLLEAEVPASTLTAIRLQMADLRIRSGPQAATPGPHSSPAFNRPVSGSPGATRERSDG